MQFLTQFLQYFHAQGQSPPRKLHNPNGQCFLRGETNVFLMSFPYGYGKIKEIQIWHNNKGESPGWFLLRASVRWFSIFIFSYHPKKLFSEFFFWKFTLNLVIITSFFRNGPVGVLIYSIYYIRCEIMILTEQFLNFALLKWWEFETQENSHIFNHKFASTIFFGHLL